MNYEQLMDSKINSNDQNENQKIEKLKESLLLLKKKMCRSHELIQQYDDKLKECERIKLELDAAKDETKKIRHEYHLTLGNFVKIELKNAEYKKDIDTLRKTIEDCETKMAGDKRHVQQLMCKVEDIEDKHSEKLMQLELTKASLEVKNKELEQELKVLKKTHELELKKIEKRRSSEIAKGNKNCSQQTEIEVKSTRDTAVNTSDDLPSAKPNKPEMSEKSVLTDEFYSLQDDPYPLFCYQCKAKLDPSPLKKICKVVTCPLLVTQTPSPPQSPELPRMPIPRAEDVQLPAANHARITGTVEEFSKGFISPFTPIDIPVDDKIADSPIVKTLQKKVENLERKSFVLFRQLKRKEKMRDNYRSNQIPPNYYPPNPFHAPLQPDLMTEFWRRIFECGSNERRSMLQSRGRQVKRIRGRRIVSRKRKRTENGAPSSWLIESTQSSQEMDVSFEEQPKLTEYTADDPPDNDALSESFRCTTNGSISASECSEERHEEKIDIRTSTPENSSIEDYDKIKDDRKVTFSRETCETVESGISPADESNETTNLVESKESAFLSKNHEAAKTLQSPSNQLAISNKSSRTDTRPTLLMKLRSLKRNSKKPPSDCTTFGTTARCSREKLTKASAVSRKVTRKNSRINKVTLQNASHLDDEYKTNIPLKKQRIAHIPPTIAEPKPVFLKTKSISNVNDSCPAAGEKIWGINTRVKEKLGIRKNSDLKDDVKLSQDSKKDEKNTILTLENEMEPHLSIFSNEADVHKFSTVAKDRPHSRTTDRSNENDPEQDRNIESSEYSGSFDNQTMIASTNEVQDSQKFATSEEERLNSRQTIKPREGDVSCIQDSSSSDEDGCAPMLINEARDEDRESSEDSGCSDDEITPTLTNEISDAQNKLLPNLLEERRSTEDNNGESTSHTRDSKIFNSEKKLKLVKEIEDLFGADSKSSSRFIDKTQELSTYRKKRHDSLKEENLTVDNETILRTQVSKESESEIKLTSVKHEITPTLTNEISDAQNKLLPNLLEERRSTEDNNGESTSHTRGSKIFNSEKKLKLVKEIEDLFGADSKSSSRFIDKTQELSTYRKKRHDSLKEENLTVDNETILRTQVSKESESEIKLTSVKHEITPTLTNEISDAQNQLLPNLLEERRSTEDNNDESTSHTRDSKIFNSEKKLKLVKEIEDLFGVDSKSSSRFIDKTRELSTYRKKKHDSLKEENLAVENETILGTQVSKESENEIKPTSVNDMRDLSKENSNQRANIEYCYAPFANEGIRDGKLKVASEEKVLTTDCSTGANCDDNLYSDTTEIITYMQMEEIVSVNSSARYSTFNDLPPQEETQLNVTFDPFSLESPMSPPLMCSQPFANSDQESTFSEKSEQRHAYRDKIEVEEHGEAPDEIATRRGVKRKLPTDGGSECTSPVKELRSRTILIGEEKNDAVKSADAEIARSSEIDRTLKEKSKKNVNVEKDALSPATLLAEYLKRKEAASEYRTKAIRNCILKMKQKQEAIITAQVTRLLDSKAWTSDVHWSVIEEVCKDSIKTHTIAKCVVNLLCEKSQIEEPLDRTYTPPAPLMNKTQQRLVAMLVGLETKRSTMIQLVQAGIEHKLFRLGRAPDVPVIQGLARMFTVLARIKKDREKVRIMCCDALYCLNLKALPLIYVVLTCWPEVFPMSGSNEELLPKCIIHSIMMQPMSGKIFKQLPLKSLLTIYYKYASSGYSSKILLTDLMTAVQERHSCSVNTAVILLAKKEGTAWTYTNIVREGLMKLIVENNCPSKYDAFYLLGNVMRSFPVPDKDGTVAEIIAQLSDLINSGQGSQDQQEGIASALLSLSRHKSTNVAKSIMKWKPGVALRSTTATQLEAFFNNHPVQWWRKIIELSLSEFSEDK